jgi:O-acetyl-ADP-ribose deacetylase (regulator of RNase III)
MSPVLAEHHLATGVSFALVEGDLTQAPLDAVVNAANPQLQHGGGLAAAISRRGGPDVQRESNAWVQQNGLARFDQPAVTGPGQLPCRCLIHAVGPVWGEGDEDRKLNVAVRSSLAAASALRLASVGLPALSTGIFGFPKARAAPIIFDAVTGYLTENPNASLRRVELFVFDRPTLEVFSQAFAERFPSPRPPLPLRGRGARG